MTIDSGLLQSRFRRSRALRNYQAEQQARSPVATYVDRDAVTGRRNLLLPDGSRASIVKLDDKTPGDIGYFAPGTSVLPGFTNSRPTI